MMDGKVLGAVPPSTCGRIYGDHSSPRWHTHDIIRTQVSRRCLPARANKHHDMHMYMCIDVCIYIYVYNSDPYPFWLKAKVRTRARSAQAAAGRAYLLLESLALAETAVTKVLYTPCCFVSHEVSPRPIAFSSPLIGAPQRYRCFFSSP